MSWDEIKRVLSENFNTIVFCLFFLFVGIFLIWVFYSWAIENPNLGTTSVRGVHYIVGAFISVLIGGAIALRRVFRKGVRFKAFRRTGGQFLPIVIVFTSLFVASYFLEKYLEDIDPYLYPNLHAKLSGVLENLWSDLLFFGVLSFLIMLIQRKEYDSTRKVEARIETLFNADTLSSEALNDLKRGIRKVGCSFVYDRTIVELKEWDSEHKLLLIEVTRSFYVRSYFNDLSAIYKPKLRLMLDDMPDGRPAGQVLSVVKAFVERKRNGHLSEGLRDEDALIDAPIELVSGEEFKWNGPEIVIEPDQVLMVRQRYQGWQKLDDNYSMHMIRQWDFGEAYVKNSLPESVNVDVQTSKPDGNTECSVVEIFAMDEKPVWSDRNLPIDTRIEMTFCSPHMQ